MESHGVHDFGLSPLLIYVVLCGVDSSAHRWDLSDRGIWISWCEMPANIWHALARGECGGEIDHDTRPVPADYFSSTYTWDQNILFFVRLNFKCEIFLVVLRVPHCHSHIWGCGILCLGKEQERWKTFKRHWAFPSIGAEWEIRGQPFEMAHTSVNHPTRKLSLTFVLKSSCLVSKNIIFKH